MAEWRIFLEAPDGTPMVSTPMTREKAIAWALDLWRLGDRILRIEADDGEVIAGSEVEMSRANGSSYAAMIVAALS